MLHESITIEQEEAVLQQVGYSREQLEADVLMIKEWLKEQHHLPPSRLTENENFLKSFLTTCKGSIEKTKRKLDTYYTVRAYSEIFENRDLRHPDNMIARKFLYLCVMPKLMGRENPVRIFVVKLQDYNPEIFSPKSYAVESLNLRDCLLREQNVSIRNIIIYDTEGISPGHLIKFNPLQLKEMLKCALDILPLRVEKGYVINAPTHMEIFVNNFVMPLLSKKIRDRVHITSKGYEDLHKFIEKKYLPEDYGGECSSLKELHEFCWQKLLEKNNWFINELSEKCDESKRIVQGDTQENPYFGVYGSLKKLVID